MNQGKLVFGQVTQHLPLTTFRRCSARYRGEHKVQSFSCLDQYVAAQVEQGMRAWLLRLVAGCWPPLSHDKWNQWGNASLNWGNYVAQYPVM